MEIINATPKDLCDVIKTVFIYATLSMIAWRGMDILASLAQRMLQP